MAVVADAGVHTARCVVTLMSNAERIEHIGDHRLYQGDCLRVLPLIPDDSVQLVVTSPPYAFDKEYEEGENYEALQELISNVAPLLLRVVKPSGFCFINFTATTRWDLLPEQMYASCFRDAGWLLHSRRIWQKPLMKVSWGPSGINLSIPCAEFENLFTFRRPPSKKEVFDRSLSVHGVWNTEKIIGRFGNGNILSRDDHPAQFPVELPILAIRLWSKPGDIVLDPFGGLFTTVCAAHHEGRVGIGIERDAGYFARGTRRVKDWVSQQTMFDAGDVS